MPATPIEKLVLVIFLSAIKKRAQRIDIRAGRDALVVDFTIDGQRVEEMQPPVPLRDAMFDQLKTMGNLPDAQPGERAAGKIHLLVGDADHFFTIVMDADGAIRRCEIVPLADNPVRPN